MSRFRADRGGNTLAIMAAALIPMAGMVGGGIDLSRMYIVKTRLQHACDAGALAGRKAMGSGVWTQSGNLPNTTAEKFFDANFPADAYGSTGTTKTFVENAGTVSGNASATVPMTLMRVLGKTSETLAVTCDAEMRLPNTDVMFVLDTTGSMGDTPTGDSVSKMSSLKTSVKCFYEIVARLDTDATCTTGAPSGGTGNQVQVRFGFMPYSMNVNVGKLLPASYFANSWKYQSREAEWTNQTTTNGTATVTSTSEQDQTTGSWTVQSNDKVSNQTQCTNNVPAKSSFTSSGAESAPQGTSVSTANPPVTTWYTTEAGYYSEYQGTYSSKNNKCNIEVRQISVTLRRNYSQTGTSTTLRSFNRWHYGQIAVDISGLKSGNGWNASFQLPIGSNGTNRTITWDGCIEERPTTRATSYYPIPSDAYDLNIDLPPTSGNANSLWGPALQQLIYARAVTDSWDQLDTADSYTKSNYSQSVGYTCPTEAKKLQTWSNATAFDSYVDSLSPSGNTYHDIGLLWGARFISPTGIFGSENALTPLGGEIDRNIIFMTDGDACTGDTNYTAYGVAWFDRRQTAANTVPTDGCTETGTLTQQVNVRTEAICTAVKNKNITLWVIAFGNLATSTETRLQNCATSGRYFKATNAATLQQTFKSIADQISALRITR